MIKQYIVELIRAERSQLLEIVSKGKIAGYKIKYAQV